jgi:hypothetical protein
MAAASGVRTRREFADIEATQQRLQELRDLGLRTEQIWYVPDVRGRRAEVEGGGGMRRAEVVGGTFAHRMRPSCVPAVQPATRTGRLLAHRRPAAQGAGPFLAAALFAWLYALTGSGRQQRKKRKLVHPDHLKTESEDVERCLRERAAAAARNVTSAPRDLPQLSRHEREIERTLLHGKRADSLGRWLVSGTRLQASDIRRRLSTACACAVVRVRVYRKQYPWSCGRRPSATAHGRPSCCFISCTGPNQRRGCNQRREWTRGRTTASTTRRRTE